VFNLGVLRELRGVEIDIAQAGTAAEVLVQLPVDSDGDLFQRPARASTTGAGIEITRPENRDFNWFGD
jgi:hypothetical protein